MKVQLDIVMGLFNSLPGKINFVLLSSFMYNIYIFSNMLLSQEQGIWNHFQISKQPRETK